MVWFPIQALLRYNRAMNAICFIFDCLHAGYLGAYGNTWINTPALDRLAAESFLFDQALIDTPELTRLYRSYWQGRHALCSEATSNAPSLPAILGKAGQKAILLTDEPLVAEHPLACDFEQVVFIEPPKQLGTAAEIEQTHLARCFLHAIDLLEQMESSDKPILLWCHFAGLGLTWDAPLRFREAYCEEGDPPPPESPEVPHCILTPNSDPDEILGLTQAYCGQIALLDACFDVFWEYFSSSPFRQNALLSLAGSRGFPLGEHGWIGPNDGPLFGETVQVPWMLHLPDGLGASARCQAMVEPSDIWATLLDAIQAIARPNSPSGQSVFPLIRQEIAAIRDRVCMMAGDRRAIRTAAWHYSTAESPALYSKPDDRWEANNVITRCHDVGNQLQIALNQYEAAIAAGNLGSLPPLSDILTRGLE